ncbi:MAG: O-antigen ligase family protein [Defluviitaleaceae bacterium]|nr:O-antigen ligase family protein [Defluviitaleaceae bacterium]
MPRKKVKTLFTKNTDQMTIRDWIYGSLLVIVVAIMPLVVRFRSAPTPPEFQAMYLSTHIPNFFSYYKGWVLGVPAVLIAIFALVEWNFGDSINFDIKALLKTPPVIASAIFLLMALVSTLLSSYRHTAWRGTVDRDEGLWILLAYFIVFFAAMYFVRGAKHAKLIMLGFAFSSIVMGLIGLSQFLERDFFMTAFGQRLLEMGMSDAQVASIAQEGGVLTPFYFSYGTLYNPNTFGKYTAMAAPVLLACALFYDDRHGWKPILVRCAFFLGGALMLVGVFGSRSLGGFTALAATVVVVIATAACRFFFQMKQQKAESETKNFSWVIGIVFVAIIGLGLFFVPVVNQRFELALSRFDEALRGEPRPIDDIIFEGEGFTVITGGQERFTLVINRLEAHPGPFTEWFLREEMWRVYDPSGQPVPLSRRNAPTSEGEPAEYVYAVPGYRNVRIQHIPGFIMYRGIIMTIDAWATDYRRVYGVDFNQSIIDMAEEIPAAGFAGRENWGSNRGYIWSRTFPLLPSRVIIGSGPDTFTQAFPQQDIVPKMFLFNNPYIPVDKAHNVFLQTWVGTGGISALALLFLYGFYLVTTFVSVVRSNMKEGTFLFGLRFGLLAGVSAFFIAAMSTDSTIGSSGVFYVLLGLGYGVNMLVGHISRDDENDAVKLDEASK